MADIYKVLRYHSHGNPNRRSVADGVIRTFQYAQRGLEGEILNAQKEEGRPSLAP